MAEQQAPLKYADRLALSKDQKSAQELSFKVEEAKQDMDAAILTQKKAIAQAERELNEAKNQEEISFKAILDAQLNLEDYKRGLAALENLKTELF